MTTLFVLGSGSAGNAFAIQSDDEVLLIDAGFSARETERRAAAAGLDLRHTTGLVLTHEHGDHTAGAARLAHTLGVPILTATGTWERLRPRMPTLPFVPLALLAQTRHGRFLIEACPTSHDAAEPIALSVTSGPGHKIAVAYDLGRPTTAVRFLLRGSHAIILEANHDEVLLRTSDYPPTVQERIAGSGGHLSNRAAAELLAGVAHPGLEAVVLAHLSARCNSAERAEAEVRPSLGRHDTLLQVARQDRPLAPITIRALC